MQRDPDKFTPPQLVNARCTECGAEVPAEFESCDDFFLATLAQIQASWGFAALARLVVDTFGMQHPKRSCKSAKSYAAHLAGLCCGLEYDGAAAVHAAIQRWLNGPAGKIGITRPQEPDHRGALTIRSVYDAGTRAEVEALVREWANDVWDAYTTQHEIARHWVREALSG